MSETLEWLSGLWLGFQAASLFEQCGIILGAMGALGIPTLAHALISNTRTAALSKAIEGDRALIEAARQVCARLSSQIAEAQEAIDRESAIEWLQRTVAKQNAPSPIVLFGNCFKDMGRLARARLALLLVESEGDAREAVRLFRISKHLDPQSSEADDDLRMTLAATVGGEARNILPSRRWPSALIDAMLFRAAIAMGRGDDAVATELTQEARRLGQVADFYTQAALQGSEAGIALSGEGIAEAAAACVRALDEIKTADRRQLIRTIVRNTSVVVAHAEFYLIGTVNIVAALDIAEALDRLAKGKLEPAEARLCVLRLSQRFRDLHVATRHPPSTRGAALAQYLAIEACRDEQERLEHLLPLDDRELGPRAYAARRKMLAEDAVETHPSLRELIGSVKEA